MAGNDPLAFVSVRQPWPFNDVGYDILTLEEVDMEGHVGIITRHRSSYVENTFIVTQQFILGDGPNWAGRLMSRITPRPEGITVKPRP